jgi:hypothetical protein
MMIGGYTWFEWMKGKSILGKEYKPTNRYFTKTLTRVKNEVYVPFETPEPFLECIRKALFGIADLEEGEDHSDQYDYWIYAQHIQEASEKYKIVIDTYYVDSIEGGKKISPGAIYKPKAPSSSHIALLQILGSPKAWAWLIPDRKGNLPLITRKCCGVCSIWMQGTKLKEHIATCMKCHCGRRHKQGDVHESICKKPEWNQKKVEDKTALKPVAKSKAHKANLAACHFADFETFPSDGQYVVYSVALKTPKKTYVRTGPECLRYFTMQLLDLRGTLWFFNGGRFDAYFLFVECVKAGIKIVKDSLLKNGSTILKFAIHTEGKGELEIKDLYRFMPGSLESNCKGFGLDPKLWKSDFDHGSVKCWEDVTKVYT